MTLFDFPGVSGFLFLAAIVCYLALYRDPGSARSSPPLPPGPRPWPLVGNVGEFPLKPKRVAELVAKYGAYSACDCHQQVSFANTMIGDVVYLSAFGTKVILLGSRQAAVDLLEKRSAIYSDRSFHEYSKL